MATKTAQSNPREFLLDHKWTIRSLLFPLLASTLDRCKSREGNSLLIKHDSAQGIQLLQKIEVCKIACQNGAPIFSGTCEQKRVIQDAPAVVLSIAL